MKILAVLRTGGEYDESHVDKLRDICAQHAPGFEFACLTDGNPDCETIPMIETWPGWWCKMEMYRLPGPYFFMDLDTVILGDISHIIEKSEHYSFSIMRDHQREQYKKYKPIKNRKCFNTAVVTWTGDQSHMYKTFKADADKWMNMFTSDQRFVQSYLIGHELVKPEPGRDYSYAITQDMVDDGPIFFDYDTDYGNNYDPNGHKIIVFHGSLRPWKQDKMPY